MNIEPNRLNTFTDWPADAPVSPQRIAKAGFFYTHNALEVECFSCGVKISNWNYGDQVMARHISLNPQCPFVLNPTSSGNITFLNPEPAVTTTPSSSGLDYKNEEVRLASFENWPKPEIVRPELLARAGFYSLKKSDNTKCAYCSGVVRAWEPSDIPDVEHKRHFPNCPFVISTINPRLQVNGTPTSEATFKNVNIINSAVDGNLDELGVQKHNGPKRADYGTVESRLRTFTSWSPNLIQTPDVLAQAGFYYEGMGDQVRCFHCDGGLRHWDPDDDPWTEHARWFPRCSFVSLVKGQDFVTACSLDNVNCSTRQNDKVHTSKKKRQVTDEELRSHMVSPAAIAALGIGIDVQRVRRAIKEKLELTGRGYTQADALVEAALNMQHEEDDGFENTSSTALNTEVRQAVASVLNDITRKGSESSDSCDNQEEVTLRSKPPNQNGKGLARKTDLSTGDDSNKRVSLEEENRLLKEARQCKICMDAEVGIVFLPCGHLATCVNCAPNLEDCPVCRSAIKATVRTFLS
ncbi:death-associated inhibitor of apoptosis 2 [Anthonomus grandis grandis]|uniref:death-associated inhibitor of apoptosis 2 n=1 Tax=Anthonomus grandis grandis TaxID=2921223 RepID=UPI00216549A3|nr:death-associated inhibitor of apoptosis 2 [Anthonomus grandis grandis]